MVLTYKSQYDMLISIKGGGSYERLVHYNVGDCIT